MFKKCTGVQKLIFYKILVCFQKSVFKKIQPPGLKSGVVFSAFKINWCTSCNCRQKEFILLKTAIRKEHRHTWKYALHNFPLVMKRKYTHSDDKIHAPLSTCWICKMQFNNLSLHIRFYHSAPQHGILKFFKFYFFRFTDGVF